MSGSLIGKKRGEQKLQLYTIACYSGTKVCEDVVYLQGLSLPRIVPVYTCHPDVIISSDPFTLKYVLNLD